MESNLSFGSQVVSGYEIQDQSLHFIIISKTQALRK